MNMGAPESTIISIVDDDESVRDAIESLLKSIGFRVEVFASAEGFLHSGHLQDTACLVLDVRMPGMTGDGLHTLPNGRCNHTSSVCTAAGVLASPEIQCQS
jgi:FixJ family two-component response regulator